MKKIILTILTILPVISFSAKDDIYSVWFTEDKGGAAIFEFKEEKDGTISGYIKDVRDKYNSDGTIVTDENNPEEEYRNRPLVGLKVIKDLVYNEKKNEFINGKIYDPTTGLWFYFKCYIKGDKMYLTGSLDKSGWLGMEKIWNKTNLKSL